jgi:hypothetical protein
MAILLGLAVIVDVLKAFTKPPTPEHKLLGLKMPATGIVVLGVRHTGSGATILGLLVAAILFFYAVGLWRLKGAEAALPRDVLQFCSAREREYCDALESRIGRLESIRSPDLAVLSAPEAAVEFADLKPSTAALFEGGALAAELESYRRLPILLERLDTALSKLAAS